jgi:hypothetical protein
VPVPDKFRVKIEASIAVVQYHSSSTPKVWEAKKKTGNENEEISIQLLITYIYLG